MGNRMTVTATSSEYPIQASEEVMCPKKHGTSNTPVQTNLRWDCDRATADRICNFNVRF